MVRLVGGGKGGGGSGGGGEEDGTEVGRKGAAALADMYFPAWRLLGNRIPLVVLGPCHRSVWVGWGGRVSIKRSSSVLVRVVSWSFC
jgi:hypothetical protein